MRRNLTDTQKLIIKCRLHPVFHRRQQQYWHFAKHKNGKSRQDSTSVW